MALTPGTRFGTYEVAESIGEGGMGEVYRATDTTLERVVAVKVLPESLASEPDRIARFEKEAKLLAALNHTNIAQIYGLEKAGGTHALVMELVEGPTLADRIAEGPIAADEALNIAKQIAAALEAAHAEGIVHRDLKPANIKLRPDGTVKVLDFGIAKALEAPGASSGPRTPALTTPAMTEAGMILGTAAYMSPEQARGRPVDQRADIWAFGCVLYEMLTGQPAFGGEDVTTTLARVLERGIDLDALPAGVSPSIRQTLELCLRKDPAKRLHAIGDVRLGLEGELAPGPGWAAASEAAAAKPLWRRMLVPAVALIVGAAIASLLALDLEPSSPVPQVQRVSVVLPEDRRLFVARTSATVAISPDGSRIAYRALVDGRFGLAVRSIDNTEPTVLIDTTTADPFISPDGNWVGFWDPASRTMRRVAVTGGPSLTIPTGGLEANTGAAWTRDGSLVFGGLQSTDGLWQLPAGADTALPLTTLDKSRGEFWHASPEVLPGDEIVLFGVATGTGRGFVWELAAVNRSTGERRMLGLPARHGRYLPTGHIVYGDRGSLWAVRFDLERMQTVGSPVAVLDGVAANAAGFTHFDVDDRGTLIYIGSSSDASPDRPMLAITGASVESKQVPLPPGRYEQPRASPDGTRLAIGRNDGQGFQIWIYDLTGAAAPRRLTFEGENAFPVWSGDGTRIAFQTNRDDGPGIYWRRVDGGGNAVRLTTAEAGTSHIPNSWSADNRHLLFDVADDSGFALWSVSVEDGKAALYGSVRSVQRTDAGFSPDGRWVAYAYSDVGGGGISANRGIYVQPFPADGSRYQVPKTNIDFHPAWGPDGKQLFYVPGSAQEPVSVDVDTTAGVTFSEPTSVAGAPVTGVISERPRGYDILPDGRFVVVNIGVTGAGEQDRINVIFNWAADVERLVP